MHCSVHVNRPEHSWMRLSDRNIDGAKWYPGPIYIFVIFITIKSTAAYYDPALCRGINRCSASVPNALLNSTSNVTGRQRGPKSKLRAGYRAPSLQRTCWLPSAVTKTNVTCCHAFSSLSVVSCTFSALCMYSKLGHHPHPLGYLCTKFCFFRSLHCWAILWRKSRTRSITHSPTHSDGQLTKII